MNQQTNKGFTIVELMLAMAFVGILMLAIAMATIHISNTYTRGMTLREVNQIGRSVTDDVYRTMAASAPVNKATDYRTTATGGALCLGSYTYVWNYGSALRSGTTTGMYRYENNTPVRFARVSDAGKGLCVSPSSLINRTTHQVVELIDSGERNLVIHKFELLDESTVNAAIGQGLHALSFVVGTNSGGEMISNANCLPPSEVTSNIDYCAMNSFEIVVRSGNSTGEE